MVFGRCHLAVSPSSRPSPVLLASGVSEHVAMNALRVSLGRETSCQDIDLFIADLVRARDKFFRMLNHVHKNV